MIKKISACIVCRRLISMGYESYTAKRKSPRIPAQIKERLTFAKDHQYWLNEWNSVIRSDEAYFEVFTRKSGPFVRCLKLESNEPSISFDVCKVLVVVVLAFAGRCWKVLMTYLWFILEEIMVLHISK